MVTTSFKTTRVNKTTFLIVEEDEYGEHPYIYAKQHPKHPVLILSDTGCNAPKNQKVQVSNLREYLETCPRPELDGEPINPLVKDADGNTYPERQYIVICTHCHYDHIGGIEAFARKGTTEAADSLPSAAHDSDGATIVASGYDRSFLTKDLATHFLGGFKDPPISLPKYSIDVWANDGGRLHAEQHIGSVGHRQRAAFSVKPCRGVPTELRPGTVNTKTSLYVQARLAWRQYIVQGMKNATQASPDALDRPSATSHDLGITFLQTPGHTPDSLAWYDEAEMCLYTGDSFYERGLGFVMPIIFPKEGDLVTFFRSLAKMLDFVRARNDEEETGERDQEAEGSDLVLVPRRVKVCAAHQSCGRDAEEMILEVLALFRKIVKGEVPILYTEKVRGEDASLWLEDYKAKYSVFMPNRLVTDAKDHAVELLARAR